MTEWPSPFEFQMLKHTKKKKERKKEKKRKRKKKKRKEGRKEGRGTSSIKYSIFTLFLMRNLELQSQTLVLGLHRESCPS